MVNFSTAHLSFTLGRKENVQAVFEENKTYTHILIENKLVESCHLKGWNCHKWYLLGCECGIHTWRKMGGNSHYHFLPIWGLHFQRTNMCIVIPPKNTTSDSSLFKCDLTCLSSSKVLNIMAYFWWCHIVSSEDRAPLWGISGNFGGASMILNI